MITPSPNAVSSSKRSTGPNSTPCNASSMRQTGHASATSRSIPPTDWSPRNWSGGGKPPCRPYKKRRPSIRVPARRPRTDLRRALSPALRETFSTVGQSLPTLWYQDSLSRAQRKALLRCLMEKVVLDREVPDTIATRIVWRGGAVSELAVPCTVGTLRDITGFAQMEAQILRLEAQGHSDEAIAERLTSQGFRSPQRPRVLASTVQTIRLRHGRLHRYRGPRPRRVPGFLPVSQLATALGVKAHWMYHLISRGRIIVGRDEASGLYLFPDRPETLEALRQLRDGQVTELRG